MIGWRAAKDTFGHVWRHPEYRRLLLIMVISGVSVSSYLPLISLFLVRSLRVDDASVGLFTLTFLAAPLVGIWVGRFSDRLPSRIPLMLAVSIWVALGRVAMSLAPTFWMAMIFGLVFGAFAGIVNAQVFAVLKDVSDRLGEEKEATVASAVRTGYSLGWAAGPVLGSLLAATLGYRAALATTALFALAAMVPLRGIGVARADSPARTSGTQSEDAETVNPPGAVNEPSTRKRGAAALWLFALACLLALTGEAVRLAYLPVLAVDRLGIALWVFGLLLSVAPLAELVAMPAAGAMADRWGLRKVFVAGLGVGALGFSAFAVSSGVFGLLAGQLLNACFIAVVLGLGVTYAQRLHPGGAGFAASAFFAAQSLSAVTGGLVGSAGAWLLGLPAMFLLPAALCAGAVALFLLATRKG